MANKSFKAPARPGSLGIEPHLNSTSSPSDSSLSPGRVGAPSLGGGHTQTKTNCKASHLGWKFPPNPMFEHDRNRGLHWPDELLSCTLAGPVRLELTRRLRHSVFKTASARPARIKDPNSVVQLEGIEPSCPLGTGFTGRGPTIGLYSYILCSAPRN